MKGRYLFLILLLPACAFAQKITLTSELRQLYDRSQLPVYRTGTIESEESTYDRKGGNDDGFAGTYSFVRRNPDSSLVMLDIDGPGVLNRIATPTPTRDTLDFYIDRAERPAFSICYHDLFTGKVYPFVRPLCDSAVGGFFCYLPIPFQKHLMIVCRGHHLQFHQLGYRLFPKGTSVASFHLPLAPAEKLALDQVAIAWDHIGLGPTSFKINALIAPGETKTIYHTNKGGRLKGLELDTAGTADLRLRISWDGENLPAVDCPLRDFFGYAFGKAAMRGWLCGTKAFHYVYFPMPFDHSAKIELVNEGRSTVQVSGRIAYSAQKRNTATEGKFYAEYRHNKLGKDDPFHVFLAIKGRGHYVGTILKTQGFKDGLTDFFEGDDTTATDGLFRMHGTGSEDYFNGGWYDVPGRWEHAESRALSGCLGYGKHPAHTGGFRIFVSDKIPFEINFYHAIEHGESIHGVPADYTSIAFYYCDREKRRQYVGPRDHSP